MNHRNIRKSVLCIALGACLGSIATTNPAHAANADGSLLGTAAPNAVVTVRNEETGFTRTVTADAEGNYRFPFLPVGEYRVEARRDGAVVGTPVDARVSLGNATKVDLGSGAASLETIEVVGDAIAAVVDVTSTESATNVTREEYSRLPVDRTLTDVALLAPGLNRGDNDLGGISFGGSSVAENSVYVNGLNVTDFYNRIGFNSTPFAFYEEVQVKTGGYSVEFGRTTGGVINAVTRSGTNEFHAGAELVWEPNQWQSEAEDRFFNGDRYYVARFDEYDRTSLNVYGSGPIIEDRLHFFAMYEFRDFQPNNTSTAGTTYFEADSDDGFYGAKVDWSITDRHLLSFLAFSDETETTRDVFAFNPTTGERGAQTNTQFVQSGGDNWSATYTGYLTDSLSVKAMYGEIERNRATSSVRDLDCNRIFDNRPAPNPTRGDQGCTSSALVEAALDEREAARLDFEWLLGDHLFRFGLDREVNTSNYERFYPGPDALRYDIFATTPGATLANGGVVPAGVNAYVRTRRLEVAGTFETEQDAYYLEDTWQATDNLVLTAGVRVEGFDNKDAAGRSYIKIDDQVAPRLGLSWDINGDGRSKLFANVGRYFLPVANVINIKQAGGFLDERVFYVFNGYENRDFNGTAFRFPLLGAQIGPLDNSQGNGQVGDLRSQVDDDMDPVYQDEAILGFQGMLDDKWSWGARGIYRKLNNAIDDMNITSNGILCNGVPRSVGFVMANPGDVLTVYTDTNCDGVNDGYVDIDTSVAGWALRDINNRYIGERGWDDPRRTYKAIELVLDRAWDDDWALNASYTYSRSEGNAEGPVTSDFNFGDSGRTEAFDDPWVNLNGYGYLPNDRRHQFKMRGTYGLGEHWQLGGTLAAASGRPISALGVGNPFDVRNFHSFYICVQNCTATTPVAQRVYELRGRGNEGRTPSTYEFGASVTYLHSFASADLRVKLAVYNLFDQQRTIEVQENQQTAITTTLNPEYGLPLGFQPPRYAQLTVTLEF